MDLSCTLYILSLPQLLGSSLNGPSSTCLLFTKRLPLLCYLETLPFVSVEWAFGIIFFCRGMDLHPLERSFSSSCLLLTKRRGGRCFTAGKQSSGRYPSAETLSACFLLNELFFSSLNSSVWMDLPLPLAYCSLRHPCFSLCWIRLLSLPLSGHFILFFLPLNRPFLSASFFTDFLPRLVLCLRRGCVRFCYS